MCEYVINLTREMVYEDLREVINQLYAKYQTKEWLKLEKTDNPMRQVEILEERHYVTKLREQIEEIYEQNQKEKFNLCDYKNAINNVSYRIAYILEQ